MSLLAIKERGPVARDQLVKTYGTLRDLVAERLAEVDTAGLKKQGRALTSQGMGLADTVRKSATKRLGGLPVPVQQKRKFPIVPVAIGGAVLIAGAATAWFLYDRRRREMVRDRFTEVSSAARERYVQLGGVSGAAQTVRDRLQKGNTNGTDLEPRVVDAIAAGGGLPNGLQVEVEGRTVYLKGAVADPAAADAAAERAHAVDGVVAVVNHTTTPSSAR